MEPRKQPKWKRLLPPVLWSLAGMGLFILLVSASGRIGELRCKGLEISIEGYKHEMFISETDVQSLIEDDLAHAVKGCRVSTMNLRRLENLLQKDNWVSKAQLFIDNQQKLHVNISERLPVARIFTQSNHSYYIDSQAVILPLSQQQVADVPVFTNLPDRPQKLAGSDSLFWQQISKMGSYIISDSFLLMQIGQIDITQQKELEMYPVVGNHVILFGKPEKWVEKLTRLKRFDKQILAKSGLNKYSRLDIRYDKQIVAVLRGTESLSPPAINITPDVETATVLHSDVPILVDDSEKEEYRTAVKSTERKVISPVNKQPQDRDIAKKNIPKKVKKPEKLASNILPKKKEEKNKSIVAAANNKTNKIALKQVPEKVKRMGIVEVDIRKKKSDKSSSPPRATMPKKQ